MSAPEGVGTQLSTIDSSGGRLWVYPADVRGRYKRRRTIIHALLVCVFLFLPWLKVNGQPAILLNVAQEQISLLGVRFWSHDAPSLLFVVLGAATLLALVTSIWGRVWCGWSCPQTVFIDGIFRRIERWIEGDALSRRRLDLEPPSLRRLILKASKWGCYTAVALVMSHSLLAYFVGTESLGAMMKQSPLSHPIPFLGMAVVTGALLLNFGWLREQFCTLLCPYGRFQSVLMDRRSLVIEYNAPRGEPRRPGTGDCVDCRRCVQVCPTGIDIRNGLQLECVGCTACIDACDTVMEKMGRPRGLIRYARGLPAGQWRAWLRPMAYFAVLLLIGGGLIWSIVMRAPLEITVARAPGAPYEILKRNQQSDQVLNHFYLELRNQSAGPLSIRLAEDRALPALPALKVDWVSAQLPIQMGPGESQRVDLFARFTESPDRPRKPIAVLSLVLQDGLGNEHSRQQLEVSLVAPLR